jgi:small-conductance mechanosensitive channel
MQVGDWVTVAGISGSVEFLSIRTVRLRGGDGSLYTVPFSSVTTVNNSNRGIGNASVKVVIAYGADVERAVQTLKDIGAEMRADENFKAGIRADFSYWGVDQVDGAGVTLVGQLSCLDTARWPVQREFNRRILERFMERGITLANPQRNFVIGLPQDATDMEGRRPKDEKDVEGRKQADAGEVEARRQPEAEDTADEAAGSKEPDAGQGGEHDRAGPGRKPE